MGLTPPAPVMATPAAIQASQRGHQGPWIPASAGMTSAWARFIAPLHKKPTLVREAIGGPGVRHTDILLYRCAGTSGSSRGGEGLWAGTVEVR